MTQLERSEADLARHDLGEASAWLRGALASVRGRARGKPRVRPGDAYVAAALEEAAILLEKRAAGINQERSAA